MNNMFDLSGKTALITGASSGLGEQFARTLSKCGARVILAARRFIKLEKLAHELGNALPVEMDVADKDSVNNAFTYLGKQGETIDICINNAGIHRMTGIFDCDGNNDFENVIQTNLLGVWYVTKAAANHMKNHHIAGSIINISSVYGQNKVSIKNGAYCASKAGVTQLTKALVGELVEFNIRINTIAPGSVQTPMSQNNNSQFIPAGFMAMPSDLDGAILYLASNKASRYVTGSCITVDGGVSWGGYYVATKKG